MIDLYARIDLRDANVLPGREAMHVGEVPAQRPALKRIERVVVAEPKKDAHSLCGFDAILAPQLVQCAHNDRMTFRFHHEAVHTERRHRPRIDDDEAMASRQAFRDAPLSELADLG